MLRAPQSGPKFTFLLTVTSHLRLLCCDPRFRTVPQSTCIRWFSLAAPPSQLQHLLSRKRAKPKRVLKSVALSVDSDEYAASYLSQVGEAQTTAWIGAGRPWRQLPIMPVSSPVERRLYRNLDAEAFLQSEQLSGSASAIGDPQASRQNNGFIPSHSSLVDLNDNDLVDENAYFQELETSSAPLFDEESNLNNADPLDALSHSGIQDAGSSSVFTSTSSELAYLQARLLHILGSSSSAIEVWESYSVLIDLPHPFGDASPHPKIPFSHLHRVCRVFARNRPKGRAQFVRLLHVLRYIHQSGGHIHVHEWNALIDHAGRGWRKTRPADFHLALELFDDMVAGRMPGAGNESMSEEVLKAELPQPNVVTYTTLLGIAARTLHVPTLRRAIAMFSASGFQPTRFTHLTMLRFFTFKRQASGIRSTLMNMKEQGLLLGLDGVNACIWAYAHTGHLNYVNDIYRVLRHHLWPELHVGSGDVDTVAQRLADEGIIIDPQARPNEITFQLVTQVMAYHGDLTAALNVFMDMLTAPNVEMGAPLSKNEDGQAVTACYSPTLPLFRALFLGFSRHGISSLDYGQTRLGLVPRETEAQWDKSTLLELFQAFMTLPKDIRPSQSVIYWIMVAFIKTSGDDPQLVRKIWTQLEERFHGPWGGPNNRLQHLRTRLLNGENPVTILNIHRHR